jgi:hypothetical protein
MTDETRLDNELAAFTDRLLAGEDAQATPEIAELAQVVRQFHRLVAPDSGPDSAFRDRLAQQLNREWEQIQQDNQASRDDPGSHSAPTHRSWQGKLTARRSTSKTRSLFGGFRSRTVRIAAVAATVVAALCVAVLIATDSDGTSGESGTVSGSIDWPVIVSIVVVALLGMFVFWLGQRSKS